MQEDSFTGRIANLVIFRVTEFGFWGQGGTAERLPPLQYLGHTPAMPDYRRNRVPGGTFFFTVNLRDPCSDLLVMQIDILRDAVRRVAPARPSASTPGLSSPIICIACGPCHEAVPTSPAGGAQSKPHL